MSSSRGATGALIRMPSGRAADMPGRISDDASEGLRRQLTVMFVDLVDFTSLSSRLDPEDLCKVLREYHTTVVREVSRFEGTVATAMGDGVMAYFGSPHAHEDDAERAVRAGAEILGSISQLKAPLQGRVGIATGVVVIDTVARIAVGETPTLAARLQEVAPPNGILLADCTRRLIRDRSFQYRDLGELALKGFGRPTRAWQLQSRKDGYPARAQRATWRAPLCGRDTELDCLADLWRRAAGGRGQLALIVGEAGIGKSRLVREAYRRLKPQPAHRGWCQCSSFYQSTPLQPITRAIARAAGLSDDMPATRQLEMLERLLADGIDDPAPALPLIAELVNLRVDGKCPATALSTIERRDRTLGVLAERVFGLARRGPVVIVIEDLHWADASTIELFDRIITELSRLPVLILATFRPEFRPHWAGLPCATTLSVGRLDAISSAAMVDGVVGSLPPADTARLIERADGVPLFIEELADAFAERSSDDSSWAANDVPATLNDALAARLDRRPEAREVALIASCLGREFDHGLLMAVSRLPALALELALERLIGAGILFRRANGSRTSYQFKHALVRDAAYAMLLRRRRRQLHARIAQALRTGFAGLAAARPELVAHHLTEAGLISEAIDQRLAAGLHAASRGAMKEAATQFRLGLDLVPQLADPRERLRLELDFQVGLGGVLITLKGEAAPEIDFAYRRARELSARTGNTDIEAAVLWGLWHNSTNRAELERARSTVEEQLRCARRTTAPMPIAVAYRCGLVTDLFSGRFRECLEGYAQLVATPPPAERASSEILLDPWISGRSMASWAWAITGDMEHARSEGRHAREAAGADGQAYLSAVVQHHVNVVAQIGGDTDTLDEGTDALLRLAQDHGFTHWHATATLLRGWLVAAGGDLAQGLGMMRRGLAAKAATGSRLKLPYYRGLMAEVLAQLGQIGEARAFIDEALGQAERTGERWFLPELLRLRAKMLMMRSGAENAAEVGLLDAIRLARGQSARLWELRAAADLARLRRGGGERDPSPATSGPLRSACGLEVVE